MIFKQLQTIIFFHLQPQGYLLPPPVWCGLHGIVQLTQCMVQPTWHAVWPTQPICGRHTACAATLTVFNLFFQQFLKNFPSVFSFSRGKKTFFSKMVQKIENIFITFQGGRGVRPHSDKNHLFLSLPQEWSVWNGLFIIHLRRN